MDNKMITNETIKDLKQTVDALFMNDLKTCLNDHNRSIDTKIENLNSALTGHYRQLKDDCPRELSKNLENSEAIKNLIKSTVTQSNQQMNSLLDNLIKDKKDLCAKSIGEAKKNIVSEIEKKTDPLLEALKTLPPKVVENLKDSGIIDKITKLTISDFKEETEKMLRDIINQLIEERDKKENAEITMVKKELTESFNSLQSIITRRVSVVTILVVMNTLLILASLIFRVL